MKTKQIVDDEELLNEKEALAIGLALVDAKWAGDSEFDKGMRLLQNLLGIDRKPKRAKKGKS